MSQVKSSKVKIATSSIRADPKRKAGLAGSISRRPGLLVNDSRPISGERGPSRADVRECGGCVGTAVRSIAFHLVQRYQSGSTLGSMGRGFAVPYFCLALDTALVAWVLFFFSTGFSRSTFHLKLLLTAPRCQFRLLLPSIIRTMPFNELKFSAVSEEEFASCDPLEPEFEHLLRHFMVGKLIHVLTQARALRTARAIVVATARAHGEPVSFPSSEWSSLLLAYQKLHPTVSRKVLRAQFYLERLLEGMESGTLRAERLKEVVSFKEEEDYLADRPDYNGLRLRDDGTLARSRRSCTSRKPSDEKELRDKYTILTHTWQMVQLRQQGRQVLKDFSAQTWATHLDWILDEEHFHLETNLVGTFVSRTSFHSAARTMSLSVFRDSLFTKLWSRPATTKPTS